MVAPHHERQIIDDSSISINAVPVVLFLNMSPPTGTLSGSCR
jgi:hypothetical protein